MSTNISTFYKLTHPKYLLGSFMTRTAKFWSDDIYLKIVFRLRMGYSLNLKNPKSFSEKLQWLKLNDCKPIYTEMVDKVAAKDYVAQIIGKEHIIPTIAVFDSVEDINWDKLPNRFVLKCTHDSGGVVICKDKSLLNKEEAKRKLALGLNKYYFMVNKEYPYKNVPRRIICEEYKEDGSGNELKDYKFMCFNGKVQCSFVCSNRHQESGLNVTFFDKEWNRMPFERLYPTDKKDIAKPSQYEIMINMAENLSKNIPFVRIDLYEINGIVYFGEMTFFPGSGMEEFRPIEWDYKLGEWIDLSLVHKLTRLTENAVI